MAGILKKIFGGFSHHHNKKEEKEKIEKEKKVSEVVAPQSIPEEVSSGRGGRGFSVQVAVPADPVVHAPVVSECNGDGGVQVSFNFVKCLFLLFSRHGSVPCSVGYKCRG